MDNNEILTIEEVAALLRVSDRTVYDWAQKGEIPCGKIGTSWRFKRADLERWIDNRIGAVGPLYSIQPPAISIADALDVRRCCRLTQNTKLEVLSAMIDVLCTSESVRSAADIAEAVFARELLLSTGIGLGIGLPHIRLPSVDNITMALGVCSTPVRDYESLDGEPVNIVVMIAAGAAQHARHLRLLALVSAKLKNENIREQIITSKNPEEMHAVMVA